MSNLGGSSLAALSGRELLMRLGDLAGKSRRMDADLLEHIGEVDRRRLYLDEAFPSMFEYCVRVLHFEEAVAFTRIHAARAARRHPELLEALRRGDLHVTALRLLAPQLTRENCRDWIRLARHRTADEIRRLIAERQPKPDVASTIARQPESAEGRASATAVASQAATAGLEVTRSIACEPAPEVNPRIPQVATSEEDSTQRLPVAVAPPPEDPRQRTRSEPLGGGRFSSFCWT